MKFVDLCDVRVAKPDYILTVDPDGDADAGIVTGIFPLRHTGNV